MGNKRRGPTLEELLARPWCYYCERDFDDLKILISHQKAKHFKCERCGRRLNTAGGLMVHMNQVHKEQLSAVDNALPNRSSLDLEIFGMEGVPEDIIQTHNQRVVTQFQQAEAERQAVTGNPPPGSGTGQPSAKKPKIESVSDMKKRLAEHRAKRAEATNGISSSEGAPAAGVGQAQAAGGFGQPPQGTASQYPPPYGAAAANTPYQQTASPVYQNFSPGGQSQFPSQYTPSGHPTQAQAGATPGQPFYGAPPSPFPSQNNTPQATPGFPQRSGSLPNAPGLPQRPSFGAPQVNSYQMQQMHMGQPIPTPSGPPSADKTPTPAPGATPTEAEQPAAAAPAEAEEKPAKKEKSKQTRLVYGDNEVSPEEKMARLPRYAFVPNRMGETSVETVPPSLVVGTIRDSDNTELDPAH